jgi:NRPS condensation-like uncharacterized protein
MTKKLPDQTEQPLPANRNWYQLDNAAKIYPVIRSSRHVSVFRLQAVLKQTIDAVLLQKALDMTLPRFPFFKVSLKRGLFWYYLETQPQQALIEPDVINPLRSMRNEDIRNLLFRVRFGDRHIAVEFFHALTDGYGASVFLKTLTGVYLHLCGFAVSPGQGFLNIDEKPDPTEAEDAYKRFSSFRVVRRPSENRAFHLQGTLYPRHQLRIITGILSAATISEKAKELHVTVTELLTACYIDQLYQIQQLGGYQTAWPVRVSVPINVRRFYPTRTLRNFALYANPGIDPAFGNYTFDEILQLVHHFMRYTITEKYLNALMCANVGPEYSWFLKLTPLPLKSLAMRLVYSRTGESRFTSTMSNLGLTEVPTGFAELVERFDFMLGPSRMNPVNCGVISFNDQLSITFTGTMTETDVERAFFTKLISLGLPVTVQSNCLPNGNLP